LYRRYRCVRRARRSCGLGRPIRTDEECVGVAGLHGACAVSQAGTVDCGPLAVLFLLAAAVLDLPHAEVAAWPVAQVTAAGRYLRARMAVDLFGVADDYVRGRHVRACAHGRSYRCSGVACAASGCGPQFTDGFVRAAWRQGSPLVAALLERVPANSPRTRPSRRVTARARASGNARVDSDADTNDDAGGVHGKGHRRAAASLAGKTARAVRGRK
jgi:hypothetical protein